MKIIKTKISGYQRTKKIKELRAIGISDEQMMEMGIRISSYWNKERCTLDALRFSDKGSWLKESPGPYKKAWKKGWLDECCAHMDVYVVQKRTQYECHLEAMKYKSRDEWRKADKTYYHYVWKKGWLDDVCGHMDFLSKRKVKCVETGEVFESLASAAKKLDLKCASTLSKIARGTRKSIHGYTFEYEVSL